MGWRTVNSQLSPGAKAPTAFEGQWEVVVNIVEYAQDTKRWGGDI